MTENCLNILAPQLPNPDLATSADAVILTWLQSIEVHDVLDFRRVLDAVLSILHVRDVHDGTSSVIQGTVFVQDGLRRRAIGPLVCGYEMRYGAGL